MNIEKYIKESIRTKENILGNKNILTNTERAIELIKKCFAQKGKILIAGNGGSAADAQHFAGEIVGRSKKERKGYPAIALTTDTSVLTAWANDYDFETIFSRQVEALGIKGDVFFGISTSGNSENIIRAIDMAKKRKMRTVSLLGKDGGKIKKISDISIIIPSDNTPRIQEAHIMLIHIICEEVEKKFK
jgi:D-sedoheptulose 7-phosphate isomerase